MSPKKHGLKIDADFITKQSEGIEDKDIKKVNDNVEKIEEIVKIGPLKRFIEDVKLLLSIVKDYWSGKYKKIPWWAISAIVFTLLYVLNPLDLIPDWIPVIGQLDDAAVVSICLVVVEQELQEYKKWKKDHPE